MNLTNMKQFRKYLKEIDSVDIALFFAIGLYTTILILNLL